MIKHLLSFVFCLFLIQPLSAASLPEDFIQLESGQGYQGQLGENEVVRFYFILDQTSDILVESRTPNRSNTVFPDAVLFNQDGRRITSDWSSGQGRNFKIERQLDAGTYVLRVEDGRGCGSLHGCPEILRDYELIFEVTEASPF